MCCFNLELRNHQLVFVQVGDIEKNIKYLEGRNPQSLIRNKSTFLNKVFCYC